VERVLAWMVERVLAWVLVSGKVFAFFSCAHTSPSGA
jgi:hypothetical protein